MSDTVYPNPEFDPFKEELRNTDDPTSFPNRKWSYTDGHLDVWPVTPYAFPEHKDVWGVEGWKDYSQGHLWYDPETEEWNVFQWPSRPQGLSEKWYHPIQKVKKIEFQEEAMHAIQNYVREHCHSEPVVADRPMPADDQGQLLYYHFGMGNIPYEQMDKLRRQADFDPQRDYTNEYTRNLYKGMGRFAYYVPTGEVVFSTATSHNNLIYELSKRVGRDLEEFEVYRDEAVKTGFMEDGKIDQGQYSSQLTPEEKAHVQAAYNVWSKSELPEQDEEDYADFFRRRWEKQAAYGDAPEPEKWQHLRDQIKDETDPTLYPNRKWSHSYGPSGYLDVWPVNDIAYPEHVDVWGGWGWENCSQGHLWYENGKWMIYPWQERPHCLSRGKPAEAKVKDQFIYDSVAAVVKYVKEVLHGIPEISNSPMPADSRGQAYYATQPIKTKKNLYPRNSVEFDINEIFQMYKFGDEGVYWDKKSGTVYWYSSDANVEQDLADVKEEFLKIPEVHNVQFSNRRPSGPWKKIASETGDELYSNLKVITLDAGEWNNSKGHIPGIYDADTNTLYMANGPSHHEDIMREVGYRKLFNMVGLDFKTYDACIIIAPSPETPREYLEVIYRWVKEQRPHCEVYVEFNGEDESRLGYHKYMQQIYIDKAGWNPHYYNQDEEYPEPDQPMTIDWSQPLNLDTFKPKALPPVQLKKLKMQQKAQEEKKLLAKIKFVKDQTLYIHNNYQKLVDSFGPAYVDQQLKIYSAQLKKHNAALYNLHMSKTATVEWYWWMYDLDTGEIAVAPDYHRSSEGLEGPLNYPKRWVGGRYWGQPRNRIKIDDFKGSTSPEEMQDAATTAVKRLMEQEKLQHFFSAKEETEFQVGDVVQAVINGKTEYGKIKADYRNGAYLVAIDGSSINWALQASSLKKIIPKEHQEQAWVIWFADEREEVEDRGLQPGTSTVLYTDQNEAQEAFKHLKNVDLYEIDTTGNDLYATDTPGKYRTNERFYPEQLHLLFGPSNPPQKKNKKKFEENVLRWAYNMETGELIVSPDEKMPKDHWEALNYPTRWMGGKYDLRGKHPTLVTIEYPGDLYLNERRDYEQDISKKLKTLPFV